MADSRDTIADRMRQAFEMFEFGVDMKVASLRRQYPTASPAEIEERLSAWLGERPCDADGVAVPPIA